MSRAGTKYAGPINSDKRLHIIAITATILATGRPTFFAYEGAARHGLRAKFCLEGFGWPIADAVAADIVHAALRRVGAQRPTDAEAHWRYTEEGYQPTLYERCLRCSRPLLDNITEQGWHLRFCSNACRVAYRNDGNERTMEDYWQAMRAAGEVRKLERTTTCADPKCGKEFIPKKPADPKNPDKPRYCSTSCAKKHYFVRVAAGELPPPKKASVAKRPKLQLSCMECGRQFHTTDAERKCCGNRCASAVAHRTRYRQPFLGPDVIPIDAPAEAPAVSSFECAEVELTPAEQGRRFNAYAASMAAE